MEDLVKLRDEIDTIDDQIVSLFEQRGKVPRWRKQRTTRD